MPAPIVAFAKDWSEDPTSNHHVLRELARTRRVLWLNSIATRTPSLASGRDLGKIRRKLEEFARGPVNVENDLWVMSPLVVPLPHSAAARAINRQILRATIRVVRAAPRHRALSPVDVLADGRRLRRHARRRSRGLLLRRRVVDVRLPRSRADRRERDAAARLGRRGVRDQRRARRREARAERADATSRPTASITRSSRARSIRDLAIPADLAALPRPRIGFDGTLRDWVDLDLLAYIARARPAWSIALIGQALDDLGPIRGIPNIHLLGQKRHDELPAYCKGFDVGLIPYRLGERMQYVNPLKLREYLSAGVPVVSTAVPEVTRYAHLAHVAHDPAEFLAAIETALGEGGPNARAARSAAMKSETWAARVADVARTVEQVTHQRGLS